RLDMIVYLSQSYSRRLNAQVCCPEFTPRLGVGAPLALCGGGGEVDARMGLDAKHPRRPSGGAQFGVQPLHPCTHRFTERIGLVGYPPSGEANGSLPRVCAVAAHPDRNRPLDGERTDARALERMPSTMECHGGLGPQLVQDGDLFFNALATLVETRPHPG